MRFSNVPLKNKFALGFSGVIGIVLLMSVSVFIGLSSIRAAANANAQSEAVLATANLALSSLVEQQNAVRGFVATGDAALLTRMQGFSQHVDEATDRLIRTAQNAEERSEAEQLKAEAAIVRRQEDEQVAARRDPARLAEAQGSLLTNGRLTKSRELLKAITDPETALVAARSNTQAAAIRTAMVILFCGSLLCALACMYVGWLLTRIIGKPIAGITQLMTQLAAGNFAVEVRGQSRGDELGAMSRAVQVFKLAGMEKQRLEAQAREQQLAAETERRRSDAVKADAAAAKVEAAVVKAKAAEQMATVVASLAAGLEKLSSGDLTFRLDAAFAADYEKLRSDFNNAMNSLQETLKTIAGVTQDIRSGTGEIAQAADDLARRTEHQAATLEETAAALDEITETVRKTAAGANDARNAVSDAQSVAEESGAVVKGAISAMAEIEKSSSAIARIISVIDDMAFQTNLLSLNAAVEAARAGDAGLSFAVVAAEVRALAQRSAEAAKEIKALITASTQHVGNGVNLVGETGSALSRIISQIGHIKGTVGDIAAAAQEQAAGLQQVNTAVTQMDQVVQQNAAMVEQSTSATRALAEETEQLGVLIGGFHIDGESQRRQSPALRRRTSA